MTSPQNIPLRAPAPSRRWALVPFNRPHTEAPRPETHAAVVEISAATPPARAGARGDRHPQD